MFPRLAAIILFLVFSVILNFAAQLPGILLDFPCCRVKGIADSHIDVFMRVVLRSIVVDDKLFLWDMDVDPDFVELAFVVMSMRGFDHNMDAGDPIEIFLQSGDLLADMLFQCRRGVHVLKLYFHWVFHNQLFCSIVEAKIIG